MEKELDKAINFCIEALNNRIEESRQVEKDAKIWLNRMVENNEALHLSDDEVEHFEAKYYFETGDFKKALEKWKISVKDAGLRYFEDEKKEYLDFYKNPENIIK